MTEPHTREEVMLTEPATATPNPEGRRQRNVWMPDALHQQFETLAQAHGRTYTSELERAMRFWVLLDRLRPASATVAHTWTALLHSLRIAHRTTDAAADPSWEDSLGDS